MIFVTVGTHEQQFNRLVKAIDDIKASGILKDEVVIQTGYSDYVPQNCTYSQFFPYQQMIEYVDKAKIIITHGGPSSFIMPLKVGKIPIVVPRQKKFDEHFNDHQVDFCEKVATRQRNIIVVENIEMLGKTIQNYDIITKLMANELKSNNAIFCEKFEKIINNLFYEKHS